jgi:hypothetical protein
MATTSNTGRSTMKMTLRRTEQAAYPEIGTGQGSST